MEKNYIFKFSSLDGIDEHQAKKILSDKFNIDDVKAENFMQGKVQFKPMEEDKIDKVIAWFSSKGIKCNKFDFNTNLKVTDIKEKPDDIIKDANKTETVIKKDEITSASTDGIGNDSLNNKTTVMERIKNFFGWILVLLFFFSIFSRVFNDIFSESKESEIARLEKERVAAVTAANYAKKIAEDKRKGVHCLTYSGKNLDVEVDVIQRMRDPDSFEHIKTKIEPVDGYGNHALSMTYRGRNGFGGMNVSTVRATISNDDCSAITHFW